MDWAKTEEFVLANISNGVKLKLNPYFSSRTYPLPILWEVGDELIISLYVSGEL
jgi:hypothetical protein